MTTHEFSQLILGYQVQSPAESMDETAIKNVSQLVSGSLIYRLYESLVVSDYNMDEVTKHLEMLYDTENYLALLYFVFILCDATDEALPEQFIEMTANIAFAPYLSSAIIEDWLDFHGDYEK